MSSLPPASEALPSDLCWWQDPQRHSSLIHWLSALLRFTSLSSAFIYYSSCTLSLCDWCLHNGCCSISWQATSPWNLQNYEIKQLLVIIKMYCTVRENLISYQVVKEQFQGTPPPSLSTTVLYTSTATHFSRKYCSVSSTVIWQH